MADRPEGIEILRERLREAVAAACPAWLSGARDDIVQVALMRVLDAAGSKGEGDGPLPSSYLRKAAYSALVDEIRRHRRRRESVPLEDDAARAVPSERAGPEQERAAAEIGRAIREGLGTLVRPRALAVTLHLQGHSVPEIARLLGWPLKRAENLVYRGLADLRETLERRGIKP